MISDRTRLNIRLRNTNDLGTIQQLIENELDYRFTQDIKKYTETINPIYKQMIDQGKV